MSERWNSIDKPQISSSYTIGSHFKYKIIIFACPRRDFYKYSIWILTKVNVMEVTDNFYLLDFVRKDWIPVLHAIIQWIPNWKIQSRDQIQNSK
jgi:hypothetical protein